MLRRINIKLVVITYLICSSCSSPVIYDKEFIPYPLSGGPLPGSIILTNTNSGDSFIIAPRDYMLSSICDKEILALKENPNIPEVVNYSNKQLFSHLKSAYKDSVTDANANLKYDDIEDIHYNYKKAKLMSLRNGVMAWDEFIANVFNDERTNLNNYIKKYDNLLFVTDVIVYEDVSLVTNLKNNKGISGRTNISEYINLDGSIMSSDSSTITISYKKPLNAAYKGIRIKKIIEKNNWLPETISESVSMNPQGGQMADLGRRVPYSFEFAAKIGQKPVCGPRKIRISLNDSIRIAKFIFDPNHSRAVHAGDTVRDSFAEILKYNTSAYIKVGESLEKLTLINEEYFEVEIEDKSLRKNISFILKNDDCRSQNVIRFHFRKDQTIPITYEWLDY